MTEGYFFVDGNDDRFEQLSPYLRAVYFAIAIAARPLHAKEILNAMERHSLHEGALTGQTPEKTLNARLSENILQEGLESLFCRTGPNTFSLRHLETNAPSFTNYEALWHFRREKIPSDENVLVAPYTSLREIIDGKFVPSEQIAFADIEKISFFMPRSVAETDLSVKQFVTYTIVRNGGRYLVFQRGVYSNRSENLQGRLSIAFGGHVSDSDFDLFSEGNQAFLNNSSRELLEELAVSGTYASIDDVNKRSKIIGYINTDENSDARQHIAVVVSVDHICQTAPESSELGIRQVTWFTISELWLHRNRFDLWSRHIIDRVHKGQI